MVKRVRPLTLFLLSISSISAGGMEFVPNQGQWPAEIAYAAANGAPASVTSDGLDLQGVRLRWGGAPWEHESPSQNTHNFYFGARPDGWRHAVPGYSILRKRHVAPGVDLLLYGQGRQLEYDLLLASPGHASAVRMVVEGAVPQADPDGSIRIGPWRQRPPKAFQQSDGHELPIASRFVVEGQVLRLELTPRFPDRPVRVDPVIDYAFQYSGEGHDRIVAAVGNTVYGMTSSMGLGAAGRRRDTDLFWRTRGPHGVTTTYWGGSGDDTLTSVAEGVLAGFTNSRDLPRPPGFLGEASRPFAGGETDGFLVNTRPFIPEATYFGGAGADRIWAMTSFGGLTLAGDTDSVDLGVAPGRDRDGFVAVWPDRTVTLVGGSAFDSLRVLQRRPGRLIAAGSTRSPDLATLSPWQERFGGEEDGLVVEWDSLDGRLLAPSRVTYSGGPGVDRYSAICTYDIQTPLSGPSLAASVPTLSPDIYLLGDSGGDLWLTRAQPDLTVPRSRVYPGSGVTQVADCYLSGWDVIAAGTTTSPGFPVKAGQQMQYGGGASDGFVAAFDPTGEIVWASFAGGAGRDAILFVDLEPVNDGSIGGTLLAGLTDSTDFPREDGKGKVTQEMEGQPGGEEGFVLRMRRAAISAPDLYVGRNLQTTLPLVGPTEPGANGIVTVRSLSPEKLLVSPAEDVTGSATVNVVDADLRRGQIIWLQALAEDGEALVSIRGRDYPERLVRIRLAASRLDTITGEYLAALPQRETSLTVGARSVAINPVDPKLLTPQSLRPGLAERIRWESSNPQVAAAFPLARRPGFSPGSYEGSVSLRGAGSAQVRALLDSVPSGDSLYQVEIGGPPRLVAPPVLIGHNLRATIRISGPSDTTFRITSEDPSRVLLSAMEFGVTRQASLEGVEIGRDFYVDALTGEGEATLLIEGGAYRQRMTIRLAPLRVAFAGWAGNPRFVAGDSVRFSLSIQPARAAVSNSPGYTVPYQTVSPGSPLFTRLDSGLLRWPPGARSGPVYYSLGANVNFWIPQMPVGQWQVGFGSIPEATEIGEPWTVEVVNPQPPAASSVLIAPGMATALDLAGLRLAQDDLRQVTVATRDPAVVRVSGRSYFDIRDVWTFDLVNTNYDRQPVVLVATGAPGSTTTVDLRTPSGRNYSLSVTVGRLSAEPALDEAIVTPGQSSVDFRLFAIDPATNRRAYNQLLTTGLPPASASARVTSGPCSIAGPLRTTFFIVTQALDVPLDCREGEAVVTLTLGSPPAPVFSSSARVKATSRRPLPASYGQPFPSRLTLGKGLQREISYRLDAQTAVTFISTDPAKVRLGADPQSPGRERVTVRNGKVYIQALVSEGAVTVLAQPENTDPVPISVHLFPATFIVALPVPTDGANRILTRDVELPFQPGEAQSLIFAPAIFDPETQAVIRGELTLAGGTEPFLLRYSVESEGVVMATSSLPFLEEGRGAVWLPYRHLKPGTAEFAVLQPDGFVESPESRLRLRLVEQQLTVQSPRAVGRNLQIPVRLQSVTGRPFLLNGQITATSRDPARLLLSADPQQAGQASVTFDAANGFYAQALAGQGTVEIELRGTGFAEKTFSLELVESQLTGPLSRPGAVVTFRAGESLALDLALAPVRDGIFLEDWNSSTVRPGFSLPIEVLVSTPEVARIQTSATGFTANTNRFVFTVIGVSPGQAQVRFRLPDGVTPPPPFDVTVTAGTIDLSASPVGRGLQGQARLFSSSTAGRVRLESMNPSRLLLSLDQRRAGSAAVEVDVPRGSDRVLFLQALGDLDGPVNVRLSGPLFETREVEIRVESPLLELFNSASEMVRLSSQGVARADFRLGNGTVSPASGPLPVRLESSDPRIFTVAPELSIPVGETQLSVPLTPVSTGRATLSLRAGGRSNAVPVEVTRGRFALSGENRVGAGTAINLSFELSFPAPAGGLLVRVTSADPDRAAVGLAGGTGQTEILVPVPAGERGVSFRLDGRRVGAANLRLSAPGYEDLAQPVTVLAVAYRFVRPATTINAGSQDDVLIQALAVDPVTREANPLSLVSSLPPGASPLRLRVTSSTAGVVQIPDNITSSSPALLSFFLRALAPGRTRLTLIVPEPFSVWSEGGSLEVTVP